MRGEEEERGSTLEPFWLMTLQLQLPGHTIPEVTLPRCQALPWPLAPATVGHTSVVHAWEREEEKETVP